jgi:hydroxypyruvate reductase
VHPSERRALARRVALEGLGACEAGALTTAALKTGAEASRGARQFVVAAGKAADAMFDAYVAATGGVHAAVIAAPDPRPRRGPRIACHAGGHPYPNGESAGAGRAALALAREVTLADQFVVLLSGGASALMAAPAPPVTLEEKVALTRWLLGAGIAIDALNTIRKHLSLVKGGRLARAAAGPVRTLALSDVCRPYDDDPSTIGSGPTAPDPTTYADAWRLLHDADPSWRGSWPGVAARLSAGLERAVDETPKPGDAAFSRSTYAVIGNRHTAARAAADAARRLGLEVRIREAALVGEAREAAVTVLNEGLTFARETGRPCCYVASGETTVTVRGSGVGGRNQELAIAAAAALASARIRATLAAVGTDGIDGPTPAAGGVVDELTVDRAAAAGCPVDAALARNDSHRCLSVLGDTVVTGPTNSNVGDLTVVVFG